MLPCVLTDFFFNNQPVPLIIQNLFCQRTLHVSGNIFAHHQQFSTAHSALVSFTQVFEDRFQAESGWISIQPLLGNGHQNLHETYQYRMYSRELLMMEKVVALNM